MDKIYLDNQATTPVDNRVLEAMLPYLKNKFGNPASRSHVFGWEANDAIEIAREHVSQIIGASPSEIVFTSGATESINLALIGFVKSEPNCHVITTKTEHKATLDVCKHLQNLGCKISYLPVDKFGLINIDDFKSKINHNTKLVSILHANNEIGVIQPIDEIGEICKERGIIFHVDAAQSVGKINFDVINSNIHLLSISAHKIYGPKGIGALYIRRKNPRIELEPIIIGGGHENGLRSGTLSVHNIVGFGEACKIFLEHNGDENSRIKSLRNQLLEGLSKKIRHIEINGSMDYRLDGNLNIRFPHVKSDSLIMAIRDIALSSGSACTSTNIQPSHVLQALGLSKKEAHSSIRIGIGRFNTKDEIDYTIERISATVNNY